MSTVNINKGDPLNEERTVIDNLIAGSQNLMGSAENPIPQHQHYQATPPLPPADCNVMSTKSPMILKSRRGRTSFSQAQLSDLEHAFAATHYPDFQTRKDLSKKLKIPDDRIQVWFQNRRAKWRKAQRQINGAGRLPPFHNSQVSVTSNPVLPPVTEIALNFTLPTRASSIRHTASLVKSDAGPNSVPVVSQPGSSGNTKPSHGYQTEHEAATQVHPGNTYLQGVYDKSSANITNTTSIPDNQRTAPSLYSLSATITSSGQYIVLGSSPNEQPTIVQQPSIPDNHHFQ